MAKWRWAHGCVGAKMMMTTGGRGMQTDFVWYDMRGAVTLNFYHRGNSDIDTNEAAREIRNLFREYGRNIICIHKYKGIYNMQVYFKYETIPSTEKINQWMGEINSVMSAC